MQNRTFLNCLNRTLSNCAYKQLLDQDNCLVVVVGVTPSSIAPVDNTTKCENIITRVELPPPFILDQQEPDYPAGCFYKDNRTSKKSHYMQVDGDTLDFQTGEKYKKPKKVDGLEIASAPESLRKYRWVLQIDNRYSQWQGLGVTQEQWESFVKTTTSDTSAKVGLATNSWNQRALALSLSDNNLFYQFLHSEKQEIHWPHFDKYLLSWENHRQCIFVPIRSLRRLHIALQHFQANGNQRKQDDLKSLFRLECVVPSRHQIAYGSKKIGKFSFEAFFKHTMDYAIRGGKTDAVEDFLDGLISQVDALLETPPKSRIYANEVIKTILSYDFNQSYPRLLSLQARLNYLKSNIYFQGFDTEKIPGFGFVSKDHHQADEYIVLAYQQGCFKEMNRDAIKIEAHYKRCLKLDSPADWEQTYLRLEKNLVYKPHPVFDYYHALLLKVYVYKMKGQGHLSADAIKLIKTRSDSILEKAIEIKNYSNALKGFVFYVKGVNLFSNKTFLKQAVREGCCLAYRHLAEVFSLKRFSREEGKVYYQKGMDARDPLAVLDFIEKILQPDIESCVSKGLFQQALNFRQQELKLLEKGKQHIDKDDIALYEFEEKIKLVQGYIDELQNNQNIKNVTASSNDISHEPVIFIDPEIKDDLIIQQLCFYKLAQAYVQQHKMQVKGKPEASWWWSTTVNVDGKNKEMAKEDAQAWKTIEQAEQSGDWISAVQLLNLFSVDEQSEVSYQNTFGM